VLMPTLPPVWIYMALEPLGSNEISPVSASPKVRVCWLVVDRIPAALRTKSPEKEAVGVPELTLRKAKSAEVEAVPPMRTSQVLLRGEMAPLASCHMPLPESSLVQEITPETSAVKAPPLSLLVQSRSEKIRLPLAPGLRVISSAEVRVMSLPEPLEVREMVVPERLMASPASPKVTWPLTVRLPELSI